MAHRGHLSTAEFRDVYEHGETLSHSWYLLRVRRAPEGGPTRWGVAVGRRMAPKAVDRNRLRRRVAAAVRDLATPIPVHAVVQLRPKGMDVHPDRLRASIMSRMADWAARCSDE